MRAAANRLASLNDAELDAVVIGGGMAGAGVARDLALRGASVALFEKGDFASGTSSRELEREIGFGRVRHWGGV